MHARTDFDRALTGATFDHPSGALRCEAVQLGELPVLGGVLALFDPFAPDGVVRIPAPQGTHRVGLVVARGGAQARPALGLMQVGRGEVVQWKPAGELWANGGLVGLVDEQWLLEARGVGAQALEAALAPAPGGQAGLLPLGDASAALLPAPPSGLVPAWWGVDEDGKPLALALDHRLLVVERHRVVRLPLDGPWTHEALGEVTITPGEPSISEAMKKTFALLGQEPPTERVVIHARGPVEGVQFDVVVGDQPVDLGVLERHEAGGRRVALVGPELPDGAELRVQLPAGRAAL